MRVYGCNVTDITHFHSSLNPQILDLADDNDVVARDIDVHELAEAQAIDD